jgi:predicted RNA-binding Zn-ribbon protein involved in translation (DUF1610 family)
MIGMDYVEGPINQMVAVACPACGSRHCSLQATARKAGVVVGGVLGAVIAAGFNCATVGAINGAVIAAVVSKRLPIAVTGAIGGAIIGFAWGALVGHAVGADIDMNVIGMHQCRECGFEFKV